MSWKTFTTNHKLCANSNVMNFMQWDCMHLNTFFIKTCAFKALHSIVKSGNIYEFSGVF